MLGTSLEIVAILLLIVANGIFALSEIAIVSARKARLRQHAQDGQHRAEVALDLANDPREFLSTIQVGITLSGTLAGAFGGATIAQELAVHFNAVPWIAPHGGSLAITLVVIAISYASLILGELVPKRLALSNPEHFAMAMASPMRFLSRLAAPAVRFLSASTDLVLRALPVRKSSESPVTEEEIKLMVEQGAEAGAVEEAEQEMIEGVFSLGDRRAAELMRPRMSVVWLDMQDGLDALRDTISRNHYSRYPVGDGSLDKILGYVHVKDLLDSCVQGRPFDLGCCIRQLPAVPETMRALKVLEVFQQSRTHIAMVINEHGAAEGLITMHDIVEALVGALPAPGENRETHLAEREDGSWLVDGITPIYELKEALGIRELPGEEESYTTVGGFVTAQLGRIPAAGDHFEAGGRRYEIVDMDRNRVDKVLVSTAAEPGVVPPGEAE